MTTVGTVISHLLAGRATIHGEEPTLTSAPICRNGVEAGRMSMETRLIDLP
jgi:hypothetical protein